MNTSDILSIVAIIISVVGFVLSRRIDSFLYGPTCRIAAFSVPRGFQILLENVGNRIMRIKRVTYTINTDKNNKALYTDNLSSLFIEIPCETRGEARLFNENLFPNSKHKLINTTFFSQDDLLKAWEIVGVITVKVEYRGPIRHFFPTYRSLDVDYDTFLDALKDENGNLRRLKAFKDTDE